MSTHHDVRVPGRLVMRLASFCFDEPALTTIIQPAVADFQREVLTGGSIGVRLRGYAALAKVLVLALFVPSAGAGAPFTWTLLGLNGASSLALLSPILYAGVAPIFGPFVAGAIVAGMALAVGLHAWKPCMQNQLARQSSTIDTRVDVVPHGGRVDDRLNESNLVRGVTDELEKPKRAHEPARTLPLLSERVDR